MVSNKQTIAVNYFEHKELLKQLRRMALVGGKTQKASDKVRVIRSKIMDFEDSRRHSQSGFKIL